MGGMQALEWARHGVRSPSKPSPPSGPRPSHSPWAVGLADAQRRAIRTDPAWRGGLYDPTTPPGQGLALARMIAMCTYRSPESFQLRFKREKHPAGHFQVESYLRYQGEKLGGPVRPQRLPDADGSHGHPRPGQRTRTPGRGPGWAATRSVGGGDPKRRPLPPSRSGGAGHGIPQAHLTWIESPHGHDAFLMEQEQVSQAIRSFRQRVAGKPDTQAGIESRVAERRTERCA